MLSTGWRSSPGADDFVKYVADVHGVSAACVRGLQLALGNRVAPADTTVLANVATTILANARMHAPFMRCVNEAHVRTYLTDVTPERHAYLARVDNRPIADTAVYLQHRREVEHERTRTQCAAAEEAREAAERQAAAERRAREELERKLQHMEAQLADAQRRCENSAGERSGFGGAATTSAPCASAQRAGGQAVGSASPSDPVGPANVPRVANKKRARPPQDVADASTVSDASGHASTSGTQRPRGGRQTPGSPQPAHQTHVKRGVPPP